MGGGGENVEPNPEPGPEIINLPIADFLANPTSGEAPLTVIFSDTSTGVGIYEYEWIFGDGNIANTKNATHTFSSAGIYDVRHQVVNSAGGHTKAGRNRKSLRPVFCFLTVKLKFAII